MGLSENLYLTELHVLKLYLVLFGLWVWGWQPVLAGANAGVEIGIGTLSAPCGLRAGEVVEFSVLARNMTDVRQVLMVFRWWPADAVTGVAGEPSEAIQALNFLAPFAPQVEGDRAEFGMASFSHLLEGQAELARFAFELAPHLTPDTRIDIWIEEVSLGPSFPEHDIIRPLRATVLSNYCNADQQVLEQAVFIRPEQAHLSFSPVSSGPVADSSAGEIRFSMRFFQRGFFLPDQNFTWTIANQGSSPVYAHTGPEVILVAPGTSGQGISSSDQQGVATILVDAEPGSASGPGRAELRACSQVDGEQVCAVARIDWDTPATAVEEERKAPLPFRLQLGQNYPNPFNAATTIPFAVPPGRAGRLRLDILNLAGQVVDELIEDHVPPGHHQVSWSGYSRQGHPLASGLYLCRLRLGTEQRVRPLLLLR